MDGQHVDAHPDDILDALGNGVVDVEEFHVEEDLAPRGLEVAGQRQSSGEGKLVSDLVEYHLVADPFDQGLGLGDRRHVKRHDQARINISKGGYTQFKRCIRHFAFPPCQPVLA